MSMTAKYFISLKIVKRIDKSVKFKLQPIFLEKENVQISKIKVSVNISRSTVLNV